MTHSTNAPQTDSHPSRNDFWLLLTLFFAFRLLTLLLLKPGGFIRDWSDFDTYLGIAQLSDYGLYPYLDFWLEWPPVIPWLMVGAYKLSLLLPQWEDPRLWFVTILGSVFVLFEVGNFALIYRLARRIFPQPEQVTRVLWLYAGLFPPVYAMLGYFDGVALFFILLSLELILANRNRWAAAVAAIGFAVKLTPILVAGVAARVLLHRFRGQPRRIIAEWAAYGAVFIAVAGSLFLPFWLIGKEWVLGFFRAVAGRSSWETVWAVLEGYYGFGEVAGNRLNAAETLFAVHPASLPWGLISLGFAALYLAAFFLLNADYAKPRKVIAFAGLTVVLFLLYSKGYSPQFLVYVLPFIILLLPNFSGLGYALALTLLNVLEQPVFFVMLPGETWLLTAIVTARFIIFVVLAIEFAAMMMVQGARFKVQWLRIGLAGMGLVAILWFAPKMLSAYQQTQFAQNPDRPVIAFLQTQATNPPAPLILTEQPLYHRLYPYLRDDFQLKLAGGDALFASAPAVGDVVAGDAQTWVLSTGPQGNGVREAAASLGNPLASFDLAGVGNLTLVDFAGNGAAPAPVAQSDNGIELVSYQASVITSTVEVTLFWQATRSLQTDYTVFTQLLDARGQFIAGHDSPPVDGTHPTSGWALRTVIPDSHRIQLPADLPPGDYRLVAGMYDASGARLFFAASGLIELAPLTLP